MPKKNWRPRIFIGVTEEEYDKLEKLIPHEFKGIIWHTIAQDLIELLEQGDGIEVLTNILARKLRLGNIVKQPFEIKEKT